MSSSNGRMNHDFETDPFPGRPRILFVGLPDNSHTHSWIDLLEGAPFNVRLFSMPAGVPPDDWHVRTYVTEYSSPPMNPRTRVRLYPERRVLRFAKRHAARSLGMGGVPELTARWLAKVVARWRPDIIHTLGVE